jgi:hypothetical protein
MCTDKPYFLTTVNPAPERWADHDATDGIRLPAWYAQEHQLVKAVEELAVACNVPPQQFAQVLLSTRSDL